MKILIVEDEEALVKVLEEKFKNEDFDVKLARDGESAISIAKEYMPDVMVLDLILPKKDGFEVLEELKSMQQFKQVPIVVLSNLGEDSDIKRSLELGASDYFVKAQHPINEVIEKVKEISIRPR